MRKCIVFQGQVAPTTQFTPQTLHFDHNYKKSSDTQPVTSQPRPRSIAELFGLVQRREENLLRRERLVGEGRLQRGEVVGANGHLGELADGREGPWGCYMLYMLYMLLL